MDRNQNARMMCGEDRLIAIAVANPSGAPTAGISARYIVSRSAYDPRPPLINKATGSGIAVSTTNVPPGYDFLLNVTLAAVDTKSLDPGFYYHEARIVESNGAIVTVMNGQMRLDPSGVSNLT